MINILFLLVLCLVTSTSHRVDGRHSTTVKEDLELEKQLKLINKPPIKSINTEFGYVVDCIDINKQPVFDHPLLKNHKLQRRPSFHIIEEATSMKISSAKSNFELEKVICPIGTVPIQRTTKDDLIRAKFLLSNKTVTNGYANRLADVSVIKRDNQRYYEVKGTTSVYNPKVTIAQESSSHVYIKNGVGDGTNKIIVGWHVFPHITGDSRTHAFASWTRDNFEKTGCYNVECPGFVQVHRMYHVGGVISKTSTFGGQKIEMSISILKDYKTKNWWLIRNGNMIGYFPESLFNNLEAADQVGWGGGAIAIDAPGPPMGSGVFPDGNFFRTCYFKNIGFKNSSSSATYGPTYGPENFQVVENMDSPKCYRVKYYGSEYQYSLLFGGPGGHGC